MKFIKFKICSILMIIISLAFKYIGTTLSMRNLKDKKSPIPTPPPGGIIPPPPGGILPPPPRGNIPPPPGGNIPPPPGKLPFPLPGNIPPPPPIAGKIPGAPASLVMNKREKMSPDKKEPVVNKNLKKFPYEALFYKDELTETIWQKVKEPGLDVSKVENRFEDVNIDKFYLINYYFDYFFKIT